MGDGKAAASLFLREQTAPIHDAVDAAYAPFDLSDRDSYAAFLAAHARALGEAEAVLAASPDLPPWRPRLPLLLEDLSDLDVLHRHPGLEPGSCFSPAAEGSGTPAQGRGGGVGTDEAWGWLYVVEGSRLGGVLLARSVAADLPKRYLSAAHLPGEWRDLRAAIDRAGEQGGERWREAALHGARSAFARYLAAAEALPIGAVSTARSPGALLA